MRARFLFLRIADRARRFQFRFEIADPVLVVVPEGQDRRLRVLLHGVAQAGDLGEDVLLTGGVGCRCRLREQAHSLRRHPFGLALDCLGRRGGRYRLRRIFALGKLRLSLAQPGLGLGQHPLGDDELVFEIRDAGVGFRRAVLGGDQTRGEVAVLRAQPVPLALKLREHGAQRRIVVGGIAAFTARPLDLGRGGIEFPLQFGDPRLVLGVGIGPRHQECLAFLLRAGKVRPGALKLLPGGIEFGLHLAQFCAAAVEIHAQALRLGGRRVELRRQIVPRGGEVGEAERDPFDRRVGGRFLRHPVDPEGRQGRCHGGEVVPLRRQVRIQRLLLAFKRDEGRSLGFQLRLAFRTDDAQFFHLGDSVGVVRTGGQPQ